MKQKEFLEKLSNAVARDFSALIEPISGYTKIVSRTKTAFVVIASILIILIMILPFFDRKETDYIAGNKKDNKHITTSTMMSPIYYGTDQNGKQFSISSDTAIRMNEEKIVLTNVHSQLYPNQKDFLNGHSTEAIYNINLKTLNLYGKIEGLYNDKYNVKTSSAQINLKDYSAYGNSKVTVSGKIGSVIADSFIMPNDKNITFKGNVFTTIYPNKSE